MPRPSKPAAPHLWPHFSRLSESGADELVVMERGDGAYLWDTRGRRYLDGLSGLFVVQAGHGRRPLAQAAARQAERLGYFPLWSFAHPGALELAERLVALAPPGMSRVFFTTGGGEAVESAWKLARHHAVLRGQPERHKVVARQTAYHGTTLGALAVTGLDAMKEVYRPILGGATRHALAAERRVGPGPDGEVETLCTLACADDIERLLLEEGPETVAAVVLEPVQNAGGCFVPEPGYWVRVREVCDRYGVLLIADEVICGFGRLGTWFGSERVGARPDLVTFAKGVTSGYSPLGGVIASADVAAAFEDGPASFAHGFTFGGHPVSCAVALANLDLLEREDLLGRVRANEAAFRASLDSLRDLPIVSETRGMGYFYGIELTKGGDAFDDAQCEWLIRRFLSRRLLELGLHCRADDRGDPVIQVAPPLICGPRELEAMSAIIRQALEEAWKELA